MNVFPTCRGFVTGTGVTPSLSRADFVIVKSAAGPISWLNVAVLFVRSGSSLFELTVAASAIVCPAVPPATVPVIVICHRRAGRGVSSGSVHTTVPPAFVGTVHVNPEPAALVAVNWLGSVSLTTTPCALSGPLFVTVSV